MATKEEILEQQRKAFGIEAPPASNADDNPEKKETPEKDVTAQQVPENKDEVTEPTDEAILQLLAKRGITVSSLDALKAPVQEESEEVKAERRNADKLSYGIKQGLFKQKDYEQFVIDSTAQEKVNLVYADFCKAYREDDPEADEADMQAAFQDKYHMNEEGTKKAALGAKQLNKAADEILKEKYAGVLGLEEAYTKYESSLKAEQEEAKKIVEATPQYKRDVEEAVGEAKSYKITIDEVGELEIELPAESLEGIKNSMLGDDLLKANILNSYDAKELKATIVNATRIKSIDAIVKSAVTKALHKKQAGVRGIPTNDISTKVKEEKMELSEEKQKALEEQKRRIGYKEPSTV